MEEIAQNATEELLGLGAKSPLFAPRGLANMSEAVSESYYVNIRAQGQNEPWMEDWPTEREAAEWVDIPYRFGFTRTVCSLR